MTNKLAWLSVVAIACALAGFLAFFNGALAQETTDGYFCDREDQITALVVSGLQRQETLNVINKAFPHACSFLHATYYAGKPVDTVKAGGKLWDIVPVMLVGVGQGSITPAEQWTASESPLVEVTWKPEYGQSPAAYIEWFKNAQTTPEAFDRFGWNSCCSHADRYVTQFRTNASRDEWWYLKDGETWERIPDFIIHWEDDPKMPEQLKVEGVLFIYQSDGRLTCFWPPKVGG